MIRERDPFGRALSALRERLRAGAYGQGQPLAIAELARELDLSTTPVREALSRLAGQGLVEDRRGRGYFSARLDLGDLIELYGLCARQVSLALEGLAAAARPRRSPDEVSARTLLATLREGPAPQEGLARFCETLLARVVASSGNRTLSACHAALSDRLGPARRIEPLVLSDLEVELGALADRFDAADWAGLQGAMAGFEARRQDVAPQIAAILREYASSI